ncbi:MerR family transcriptional regulator [Cytobacillus oceanisediminis]|uniref:MerR family transcriptional regulator n=1 Tax=Niallia alba TaxID=2729105 RepID=A0A7Y0KAX6_9BACI|nr:MULTISPECIES: MerR family transcriptional regulator [Bacillaceae]MBZ9534476.1 MerR family transcriptional regulator [Cytobacillus oceanisediminis]NMO79109.1 MerR family transcriptional regulator [Niallia alba]UTI42452.1 MerR family transcriptional regulator [Niallia sp. RD1]
MKIGEFATLLNTTKETVRQYEELNLLQPHNKKDYGDKEILDFQVVKELQEYGFSLKDIQLIFSLKEAVDCGDKQLIGQVYQIFTGQLEKLLQEEKEIQERRLIIENEAKKLRDLL